jgi:hypothetical protein
MTLLLLLRPRAPYIPALPDGRSTVHVVDRLSFDLALEGTAEEDGSRLTVEDAA